MSTDRTTAHRAASHRAAERESEAPDLGLAVLDGEAGSDTGGEHGLPSDQGPPSAQGSPSDQDPPSEHGPPSEPGPPSEQGQESGSAEDPVPGTGRSIGSVVGNILLNLAAACGAVCLLAVIAALIFDITLVMFSTGSMSPTIPAGSVAVVREIPAGEVAVGDVVTVDRPGKLPVTHRVVGIDAGSGPDQRLLTLRGDANPVDDAQPYPVSTVRVVMFSVPKLASVIVALSNPFLLGAITLAAAALVTWAFWPRDPGQQRGRRHRRSAPGSGAGAAGSVAAVALAGTALLLPGHRADAAPGETVEVIRGSVITLTSIGDRSAMTNLQPGGGAGWQVGVSADAPEPGRIELSMVVDPDPLPHTGSGTMDGSGVGIRLRVSACAERWVDGACSSGGSSVLVAAGAEELAGSRPLGVMPASEQRWLLVRAELPAESGVRPGDRAEVTIVAAGFGDTVRSDPGGLAETGAGDLRLPALLALAAVLGGIGLTLLARLRLSGVGGRRSDRDHR